MGQAAAVLAVLALVGVGGGLDADPDEPDERAQVALEVDVGLVSAHAEARGPSTTASDAAAASASLGDDEETASVSVPDVDAVDPATVVLDRVAAMPVTIEPGLQLPGPVVVDLDEAKQAPDERRERPAMAASAAAPAPAAADEAGDEAAPVAVAVAPVASMAALGAANGAHRLPGLRRILGAAPGVGMYSRITREELLDHETREAVYELLQERPGCSIREIAEAIDVSRSTARHHVRKLVDADVIDHRRLGRSRVHFPVGREREAVARHLLDNETRARVAAQLADAPRSVTEIADALGANAGSVHFHLEKLCEAGLVERRENGSITYRAEDFSF